MLKAAIAERDGQKLTLLNALSEAQAIDTRSKTAPAASALNQGVRFLAYTDSALLGQPEDWLGE